MSKVIVYNPEYKGIRLDAYARDENKTHYRYAEIMPYHTLGTGKSEKTGSVSAYARENACDDEISRWCSLFASHGTDVRVSK